MHRLQILCKHKLPNKIIESENKKNPTYYICMYVNEEKNYIVEKCA